MYLYEKQEKRIVKMNEIAEKDKTPKFDLLKQYAKEHPVIMEDVLIGFLAHPNSPAIGNTLFAFCMGVESGHIKLDQ